MLVSGEPWMYSGMTRKAKARVIQGEETVVVKEYSGPTGKNVGRLLVQMTSGCCQTLYLSEDRQPAASSAVSE